VKPGTLCGAFGAKIRSQKLASYADRVEPYGGGIILCSPQKILLVRSRQTPVPVGFGARLSGTQLTFLSGFGATSGAPHRQCLLFGDLHGCIMHAHCAAIWSILTSPPRARSLILEIRYHHKKMPCDPAGVKHLCPFLVRVPRSGNQRSARFGAVQDIDVST
jgi:hypothetical protein